MQPSLDQLQLKPEALVGYSKAKSREDRVRAIAAALEGSCQPAIAPLLKEIEVQRDAGVHKAKRNVSVQAGSFPVSVFKRKAADEDQTDNSHLDHSTKRAQLEDHSPDTKILLADIKEDMKKLLIIIENDIQVRKVRDAAFDNHPQGFVEALGDVLGVGGSDAELG
ncbi:hypothetical protein CVT26_004415 [Gymnopilus dilepis]|uniref:Uncharacterized protein n=1 Tax=Gymnopilus dilepis TaxID=231916 RepID=A0A409WNA4_9AGAR|nr:hypothetical protein CVT26_004415 [Gymnopilus dilepis]